MRQLLLDLLPPLPPRLENFVVGNNTETVVALSNWLLDDSETADVCFYLWGDLGAGKSHLLEGCDFPLLNGAETTEWGDIDCTYLAVDNIEALTPANQIALFNFFNRCRHQGGKLLVAATSAPRQLNVREDLRTRLGSGLIYRLLPLEDHEKQEAITLHCRERGMRLSSEVIAYLLRHAPRDMRNLMTLIDLLDRYSLERKRAITIPLLRAVLSTPAEQLLG